MSELSSFLQANIIPIYFVYGLAHFVIGIAVALETGRASQLRLSRALPLLAAFGITHGINEWIEMFSMISAQISTLAQEPLWAESLKLGWKALSFLFLLAFGASLLDSLASGRSRWRRRLLPGAFAIYGLGVLAIYLRVPPNDASQSAIAEIWTNYSLGIPSAIVAMAGLLAQRRAFLRDNMPQFGRDFVGAAVALGWYAVLDQIFDSPANFFPALVLNKETFLALFGIPIEIFRTLVIGTLAFFIIRTMRIFEVEYARRLEAANRARFEAQEAATRELRVMFETCRILGSSLDINQIVNDAITRIVLQLDPMIAGMIYLYHSAEDALVRRASQLRAAVVLSAAESNCASQIAQDAFESSEIAYATEQASETSFIAVPLVSQGKTVGAMCLAHRKAFSNYAVIHTLARQLGIALENAWLYEQVHKKEELRGQLLERAVAAQEEERKRIARELHDEIGQLLTALAVGLGGVEQTIAQEPERAQYQVIELKNMTMHAIESLRQFVSDLRPSVLDDMGLVSALRWFVGQFAERSKLQVDFEVVGTKRRLPSQVETVLFRIAQEGLNNVGRHAHASLALVRLEFIDPLVILTVEDNGRGFVVEQVIGTPVKRAWGLLGVQERVELVGGKFRIDSSPGRGTRLIVEIPVGETRQDAAARG